jgi:O-antigen/teichoic acid export membrane protein
VTRSSANLMVGGTLQVLVAESLVLPTGLIAAAFLTRRLGPDGYGLLALTGSLVSWFEWSITTIFGRTVIKLVGEADDWRPVAATVVRLHLLASVACMASLWLAAPLLSTLLHEPALVTYLFLYALDIPLFSLAQAHRNILIGVGDFTPRALAAAGRWLSRLLLILVLVELGLSVPGAILANLGASVVELAIARWHIRPAWFGRSSFPLRRLSAYAVPLSLMSLSLRFYDKLDLFVLKALGASAGQAGLYNAAQNLAWVPSIFAAACVPLLLAMLAADLRLGDWPAARTLGRQALRLSVALLPLGALAAGAGSEIVALAYGTAFRPAAIVFGPLVVGELVSMMASVATVIMIAADQPALTFALTGPLIPLAILGHLLVIPTGGPLGAALVTSLLNVVDTLVVFWAVRRLWRIAPPAATVVRAVLLSILAYAAGALWPAPGIWVLVKLPILVMGVGAAYWLLGELSAGEIRWLIAWARAGLRWPLLPDRTSSEV